VTTPPAGADDIGSRGGVFGRRKGHPLRATQAALFESLLPGLALDLDRPPPTVLRTLFARPVGAVRLEIGFGGAEHLLSEAARCPDTGFIGAEPFLNGVAKALAGIAGGGHDNIRLHHGDALPLLDWLPPASLVRVDLLYPDPWPKARHWKRRFVNPRNLDRLARVLAAGGELRFATDWPGYAAWTLERMRQRSDFAWTAERAGDWRDPWENWPGTRYEAKALREGRVPGYFRFRRR
jgi:tRNA (guanine-N7-)-methyltransferase